MPMALKFLHQSPNQNPALCGPAFVLSSAPCCTSQVCPQSHAGCGTGISISHLNVLCQIVCYEFHVNLNLTNIYLGEKISYLL